MSVEAVTISVVLPTYNTSVSFLREAVDSILNQTFQDFEFIIIDDGSTNDSREYLDMLKDSRIHIIRNEKNLGITKSLNIGFRAARGKYIARMDGDDISLPERFEKQFVFMESHPDTIACGARTTFAGRAIPKAQKEMETMERYKVRMLFANPGPQHPTAFFRRDKLIQYKISYDEQLQYAQDYGMWMTVSQYGKICILPEVLLLRRYHPDQISRAHRAQQIQCDKMTQKKLLVQLLGSVTDEELDLHYAYSLGDSPDTVITPEIGAWYKRLLKANKYRRLYSQRELRQRIDWIQRKLIDRTFRKEMSKYEKAMLFFRYLSVPAAINATADTIVRKIKGEYIRHCLNRREQ